MKTKPHTTTRAWIVTILSFIVSYKYIDDAKPGFNGIVFGICGLFWLMLSVEETWEIMKQKILKSPIHEGYLKRRNNKLIKQGDLLPCKVILVKTEDISDLIRLTRGSGAGNIVLKKYYGSAWEDMGDFHQHLYLVSDRDLKEGDYAIIKTALPSGDGPYVIGKVEAVYHNTLKLVMKNKSTCETEKKSYRKIEAATDPSLNLPLIPFSFLDDYTREKSEINDVLIEMRTCGICCSPNPPAFHYPDCGKCDRYKEEKTVKTTYGHTVIIHRII